MKEQTLQAIKLGNLIRQAREAKGITLRALASKAGINPGAMSRLENGSTGKPTVEVLKKISRTLQIPLEELYVLAGHVRTEGLPALPVYLRSKYGLTAEEAAEVNQEVEKQFKRLRQRRAKKGGKS